MPSYTAIIPCRANSKGLTNKNLRLLDGEPLWLRATNQALRICDEVIVTSDIPKVKLTPMPEKVTFNPRPDYISTDDTKMESVIYYIIKTYKLEKKNLILLQPTSPLRKDSDIKNAIRIFEQGKFSLVMSLTQKESKILKYGFFSGTNFSPVNHPKYCFENRQELPLVYAPNGAIYIFSAREFMKDRSFPSDNMGGSLMEPIFSTDIDNENDLEAAAKLIRSEKV